ncbi:MAG: zinc ribbon domain-containing protein [Nanoarchaeota archaeon]|nr:zinc ribbon domain-containing protein [Nanoarchaeota archaeon]MCG2717746.1 zinc ribbon domain-containing protein [Nanoarchaeota archaeon]
MVKVTLYAKPNTSNPPLSIKSLESGIFDPHIRWGGFVNLTDIGEVIWQIANSMDANASVGCGYRNGYTKWKDGFIDIIIRTSALTVLLTPKQIGFIRDSVGNVKGGVYALKIQFEGGMENIQFVVKKLVDILDYPPYEFKEYWQKLQQDYNVSRLEVVEKWKAFLEPTQPKGESGGIYCTQCGKTLRADAKFCDQCGGRIE